MNSQKTKSLKQGTKRPRKERKCSNCKKTGHARSYCPDLAGLNKYQKRGANRYWNKQGEIKIFDCVSGTTCKNTWCMRSCLSGSKCPECYEVRLMGLDLKRARIVKEYNEMPDRCNNCDPRCPISEAEGHQRTICSNKKASPKKKRICSIQDCGVRKSRMASCDKCKLPFCGTHCKLQYTDKFAMHVSCKACGGIYY